VLDLDMSGYSDNCCVIPDNPFTIRWRIDFDGTEDASSISGTGQPSELNYDIELWGDGINFQNRIHTITYWVTDCHGNESQEIVRNIIITPRPEITKVTGQP